MSWNATGVMPKELEPAPFPDGLRYVWEWFVELSQGRQSNGVGPMPFSYNEILAWATLTGNTISPFDLKIIKGLDMIALKERK